jgi:predicted phosphodiesterase
MHLTIHVLDKQEMKIQIASDIHIERSGVCFRDTIDTSAKAEVLVLAGDIGCPLQESYKNFLRLCHENFEHVIVICGNHEYRSCMPMTFQDVDSIVSNFCKTLQNHKGHHVYFLNNGNKVRIGNLNLIGATLWTKIPDTVGKDCIDAIDKSFQGMAIDPSTPFTVENMNTLFQMHLNGIERSIRMKEAGTHNIIITHHAPFLKGMYKKEDYPKNYLYGTELSQYLKFDIAHTWIYGHTHWNTLANFNGTMVVTNQRSGNEVPTRGWDTSCVLTFP